LHVRNRNALTRNDAGSSGSTKGAQIGVEVGTDGTLRVHLEGRWNLAGGLPSTRLLDQALRGSPPPRAVTFETAKLVSWDSSALLVLDRIEALCRGRGVPVELAGLPEGAHRLLALADAVPEKRDARPPGTRPPWLVRVGQAATAGGRGARESIAFLGDTTLAFARLLRGQATFRARDIALVVQECGPQALPIVTLINFLVGLIIAFVGAVELQKFGATIYVADLVAIATVRELGCIMTGIIMAGRTGSGFAAQLGTMNVNQEIEALVTMGVPPMEFLVLPRILALSLMMPLLCLYADLIGILGGATVAVGLLAQSPTQYWVETRSAIGFTSVGLGIGKSVVFGVLIALAGCLRGTRCGRDAAAVGQAATSAVVLAIVWIIATDGIFAVICNVVGI
jgi:phospholipid/cholesterol/gamma-HCH transport system permease protein